MRLRLPEQEAGAHFMLRCGAEKRCGERAVSLNSRDTDALTQVQANIFALACSTSNVTISIRKLSQLPHDPAVVFVFA